MKRFAVVILALVLLLLGTALADNQEQALVVGSSFFFGKYEQDNNLTNGEEPIEWIVLTVDNGKALLVSRYALDCLPYNDEKTDMTWQNSSIRNWLATSFFQSAFSADEQAAVIQTTIRNDRGEGNAEWSTNGGNSTIDSVFLLSVHDIGLYFQGGQSFKTSGTEYARTKGAKFLGVTSLGVGDTDWWLRSPGEKQSEAAFVGTVVHSIASKGISDHIGVRPAIWYDISADQTAFPYTIYYLAAANAEAGDYAAAADGFESLGTYHDSISNSQQYRYAQANAARENEEFAVAAMLYEKLGSYEDSQTCLRDARYHQAVAAQDAGDYDKAIELFTLVGQYNDSMTRL